MIFKGLNSVISIILALSLLSGGLTIFYYEIGSALEIIFGKMISEKLYNNAQLATVGVKSTATYTLPPYTRAGFHKVTAMDGNTGSIVYTYNYEPYDSVRNRLQFIKAILTNAELLLNAGIGELEDGGSIATLKKLDITLNEIQAAFAFINWVSSHITGTTEMVKGGNAYYIPMKILLENGEDHYTIEGGETYTIGMRRTFDYTINSHIIYWNVTQ